MNIRTWARVGSFLLVFLGGASVVAKAEPIVSCDTLQNAVAYVLREHLIFKDFNSEVSKRTEQGFFDRLMENKLFFTQSTANSLHFYHALNAQNPYIFKSQFERNDCSYLFDQVGRVSKAYLALVEGLSSSEVLEKKLVALMAKGKKKIFISKRYPTTVAKIEEKALKSLALQMLALKEEYAKSEADKEISDEDIAKYAIKAFLAKIHAFESKVASLAETQFLKAFAEALDPHSEYLDDEETKDFDAHNSGSFGGIGAQLETHVFGARITKLVKDSPSERVGLKKGDIITEINGEDIQGQDLDEVVSKIRGGEFSFLRLTTGRLVSGKIAEKHEWSMFRQQIKESSSQSISRRETIDGKSILVIKFSSFYSGVSQEVNKALVEEAKKAPIDGVLLDLRFNPGGYVGEAISLVGLFIPTGAVIGIKGTDTDEDGDVKSDPSRYMAYKGPLVVAINEGTASAAEITAGTLSDYSRAIVVGSKASFGKGSVQSILNDPATKIYLPHGMFKVTTSMYFTAGGVSPQFQGVSSNIEVPSPKWVGQVIEREKDKKYAIKPLEWLGPLYDWNDMKEIRNPKRYDNVRELKKIRDERVKKDADYQKYLKEGKGTGDIQLKEILQITSDYVKMQ